MEPHFDDDDNERAALITLLCAALILVGLLAANKLWLIMAAQ